MLLLCKYSTELGIRLRLDVQCQQILPLEQVYYMAVSITEATPV